MFSDRDYMEYSLVRNLTFVVPVERSYIDPKAGPAEQEEMRRADLIESKVRRHRKSEKMKKDEEEW